MVYRGRPSMGCKRCRERKIKCDERPAGCVKCAERGTSCPGYDRTVDDFFHDETANVQVKAKKAKAKAIAARDARDIGHSQKALSQVRSHEPPAYGIQMMSSLVDQGIAFFMHHYATGVDQPPIHTQAYHKHLSTDGFHPLVATSMTALGIAGVANLYMDSNLKREATRWYLNAIKMSNAAISSPKEVKADTTLVAVNLLGLFEATSNNNSLAGWSNHVDGAASLVKMRGKDQFATLTGQRMYLHTVSLLTMNCMGKGIAVPQYVRELNNEVLSFLDPKDPRNAFFFLHINTIDLRAQILNQKLLSLTDIIQRALELDEIALSIFRDASPEWNYEEVPRNIQAGVFSDFYHVYPSAITAQTWNWVRYNRIYFHDIIRNSILAGFATIPPTLVGSEYHKQLETSTQTLYRLQSDIIASIPQFLHDVPMTAPSRTDYSTNSCIPDSSSIDTDVFASYNSIQDWLTPPTSPSPSHRATTPSSQGASKALHKNFRDDSIPRPILGNVSITDRLPVVRVSGGYSTVWALYVAGSMPMASPTSQDFIHTCLTRIEREFGINQARVLADALQLKRYLDKKGAMPFGICPHYLPTDEEPHIPYPEAGNVGSVSPGVVLEGELQDGVPSTIDMQFMD